MKRQVLRNIHYSEVDIEINFCYFGELETARKLAVTERVKTTHVTENTKNTWKKEQGY